MGCILVVGSSGFVGKNLCNKLKEVGYKIIEHDSSCGRVENTNFKEKYKDVKISHIFHLASQTFVPSSWEKSEKFYKVSVIGTQNILELSRVKSVPITFTSAYIYDTKVELPTSENDSINPSNPYAHSKYLAEELCKFYSTNFNVKIVIARLFNIFGNHQKSYFLIPSILEQIKVSDEIRVKTLLASRDLLYVKDLVDGLIATINTKDIFNIYNFGSGKKYTIKQIIDTILEVTNTSKIIISEHIERQNEIFETLADISKAKKQLNWCPKYNLRDGIEDMLFGDCNE